MKINDTAFTVIGVDTFGTGAALRRGPSEPGQQNTAITVQRATFFGNTEDWRFRAIVTLLMVIVGMVLVIAWANLANMLLAA